MKVSTKAHIKPFIIALLWLFTIATQSYAANYTVSSADDLDALSLSPGDVVTWVDGTYSDQDITFTGSGTSSNPIILIAETSGGVIFTGSSELNIYGSYLTVEGFLWSGGEGTSDHVEFRKSGSNTEFANNCTIRNCGFDNLFTTEPEKSRWIVLHGTDNVVENCSFVNKLSAGACILVELEYSGSSTPGHTIRNNYFYNITAKDDFSTNSGDCEAIRIGVSSYQSVSAQVLVEGNYFQAADGENEIITNKSTDNTFLHNTFRNCRGSLVLRHGAGAYIEGNFFLGEGKASSGGIRVSDSDHVIVNNYMQGLSNDGDTWNNGITLVGGGESSGGSGNGYQYVDNVLIAFNTIYNSDDPIHYNDRNSYDPTGTIAYNLVYSTNGDIVSGDIDGTGSGMTYVGNVFGGSSVGVSDAGIIEGDANFSANGEIFKPSSTGIAANVAGSTYSFVDLDVEGLARPSSNMDIGAHEVSGGSGSVIYVPITDSDVGGDVGACFIDATGSSISCSTGGNSLSLSSLADFTSGSGNNTLSVSSNVSWSASDNATWMALSPTTGSDDGSITVTVTANTSSVDRTGTITVTGGSLTRTTSVIQAGVVQNVSVTGVNLSSSSTTVVVGSTQQLSESVTPTNATNQGVSYSSSNASVAIVSSNGIVTAIAEGSVTITGTTDDGGFTDTIAITVTAPSTGTNLALNKSITSTGTADGTNIVTNLVDGFTSTRWAVEGYPQTATIDLGAVFTLGSTELVCYSDRAYQYTVSVSSTESGTYTEIVDRSDNTTPGTIASPIIDYFDVSARYVKITVTGADVYNEESWVSLLEFRVFAGEEGPQDISVTGLSITPSSASWTVDETQQLSSIVTPSDATNQGVSYSSSDTSVAEVDSNGVVTTIAAGSATITATTDDGGFTDTTVITVTDPQDISVTGLSITPSSASLTVDEIQQLSSIVTPSDATNQDVSYSSSDTSVAEVDSSGVITAIAAGSATITATTDDGGFTDTTVITVTGSSIGVNLALSKSVSSTSIAQEGNELSYLVDGLNTTRWAAEGYPQTVTIDLGAVYTLGSTEVICYLDRAYQYTVSVSSTEDGRYTEVVDRSGNTTAGSEISPLIDSFSGTDARYVKVTITGANTYVGTWVSLFEVRIFAGNGDPQDISVTGLSITPSIASLTIDETQQLFSTVTPSNATSQGVSYSSSDALVATVSSSGIVTAIAAGSATITATTDDGGFTDTTVITVTDSSIGVNLALNKSVSSTSIAQEGNELSYLVDGLNATRWAAEGYPQTVTIDLGAVYTLGSTEVICYLDRAYQYTVSVSSTEDGTYIEVVDRSGNTTAGSEISPLIDSFSGTDARYVKVTITGANTYAGTWVSLFEVRVFAGEEDSQDVPVTGVSIIPSSVLLATGGTQQLSSAVTPSNATNQGVSYSSSNTSVATVSSSGVVTAIVEGSATITATTSDGGLTDAVVITVTDISIDINLALNKAVYGTGMVDGTNVVANLVDGFISTRWAVEGYPQTATVDLGAVYRLGRTEVVCYLDRAYQYTVSVSSTEGGTYTEVVDRSGNTIGGSEISPLTDYFTGIDGRYVKITVTGANSYVEESWVSLLEFRVFAGNGETITNFNELTLDNSSSRLALTKAESTSSLEETVSLWPNPATNVVNVSGVENFSSITVYNQVGELIMNQSVQGSSVDISQLTPGLYNFMISGNGKVISRRIIKK